MTAFRTATLVELSEILNWAAAEGWNPGIDDAEAFFAADPKGFFVATNAKGDIIAAISVVNHTPGYAFLGLYIVRPEYRGQGIGFGLWNHAMEHAGARTVGLDGVEAQQENYAASGFSHSGGTTRFTGPVAGSLIQTIRPASGKDQETLIALAAAASGVAKPAYLSAWFTDADRRATYVSEDESGINGLCTIRACRTGTKIGPLVAESTEVARSLIAHAAAQFEGPITLDVPQTATDLVALCQTLGLDAGFKTARMYRGPFQATPHPVFAVASLELG